MSADIIQVIQRPKRDDMQTDFPTIVFRSALQNPASDSVRASSGKSTAPAVREV